MKRTWRLEALLLACAPFLIGQAPLKALLTGEGAELAPQQSPFPLPEQISAERRGLAERIAALVARLESMTTDEDAQLTRGLNAELDALERLDGIYAQQLATLQRRIELSGELQAVKNQLAAPTRGEPIESPPYSLALLDQRRAELEAEVERHTVVTDSLRAASGSLKQAMSAERAVERERDELENELDNQSDTVREAALRQRLRARVAAVETARQLTLLRKLENDNERTAKSVHALRRTLLERQVSWIRERLELSNRDLEVPLADIEKETFQLNSDLESAKLKLAAAEHRVQQIQRRADAAAGPSAALVEEQEAARLALLNRQQAIALLSGRLARLETMREVWTQRLAVVKGSVDAHQLREWLDTGVKLREDLERQMRRANARLSELRSTRQSVLAQIDRAQAAGNRSTIWLREQDRHLRTLVGLYETDLSALAADEQLLGWYLADIEAEQETLPIVERAREGLSRILSVWRHEVFTIEGNAITVATLVSALLLFLLGFTMSRYFSRLLGRRLLPRFGLQTGATAALQELTFYLLFVFFTLVALRMLNVPLTAFTVLGGALAIGVGFGSQNIVNNFISGLILLIEQPIKVDDLIEVDGTYGKVERIGTRSTRVRTFSNIHIIVPNSTFLEKNVINWTHSDNLVRVQVNVGVAYGSPTREVERLILRALDQNPRIIDHPIPEVFFADFGDNALIFHSYFWIRIDNQNDRRRIESDVRFRIDELFGEHGITIAFPQRDVHLDTQRPLDVRVVRNTDE